LSARRSLSLAFAACFSLLFHGAIGEPSPPHSSPSPIPRVSPGSGVEFVPVPHASILSKLVLRGTIVTPNEVLVEGLLTITGTKIAHVGSARADVGFDAVETGSFIFPGLIDLHNHITWNVLPRWKPDEIFANRYEWQQRPAYKSALVKPHDNLYPDLICDADRYGEVKAIVGGATSIVGSLGPSDPSTNPPSNSCIVGLARNLDRYSGFGPWGKLNDEKLKYEVFPFEMGLSEAKPICGDLKSEALKAFLIHVGEGTDAASAREFAMLARHNDGFLCPGVSIIHGVAFGRAEFLQMAGKGVGLIWSPRSNIELYGATTDVRAAKGACVLGTCLKIALAPDWSPSGSDGVLQELNYAASWNAKQRSPLFTDAELVNMVTVVPAQLAGLDKEIGSLTPGLYADLLLIRKSSDRTPFGALVHANPGDVRLVIVNGVPVYGDLDLMSKVLPGSHLETITVCGKQKSLYMDPQNNIPSTQRPFTQIFNNLDTHLKAWGSSLAPLATCEGSS
jgi:5-methylthioadenosine/S-adenosylhomocysteine deaminase